MYTCIYMYVYIHSPTHVHTNTQTHTHIHTHTTHTHTHTHIAQGGPTSCGHRFDVNRKHKRVMIEHAHNCT